MADKLPDPIQARSKIKSVQPTLKEDGSHSTYIYLGKKYYEFVVETEVGHRGRAAAMKETFRWNPGDDVNYSFQEDPIHGDRIKNITSAEPKPTETDMPPSREDGPPPPGIDQAPKASSRYTADPHKQSLIVAEACLKAAVEWACTQANLQYMRWKDEPAKTVAEVKKREKEQINTSHLLPIAAHLEKWVYDYEKRRKK